MPLKTKAYFDNMTVMPILPEAVKAVQSRLVGLHGDPRSGNLPGREARRLLEEMEEKVASLFGGNMACIFCDGDQAAGLSVLAAARCAGEEGRRSIAVSPVESTPVVSALKILKREGFGITVLKTDPDGRVSLEDARKAVTEDTAAVVCQWASCVSGIIQPVEELGELALSRGALMCSDGRSAAGRIPVNISAYPVSVLSVSSRKLGGPAGAGAVILSDGPRGFRAAVPEFVSCTPVPAASGMIAAMEISTGDLGPRAETLNQLRAAMLEGLRNLNLDYSVVGGSTDVLLPGSVLMKLNDPIEHLHASLEQEGVILPSHNSFERISYLRRLGLDDSEPEDYLGFAMDTRNTLSDVGHFTDGLGRIVSRLEE